MSIKELDVPSDPISFLDFPAEHPVALSDGMKVLVLHPPSRFLWVSSFGPLPQCSEDRIIHFHEGLFARYVPVIVCPTPDFGIELHDQVPGCRLSIFLDEFLDSGEKRLDVLLGRFYQHFSILVLAYVLT